jgi:hypothetical protein
MRQAAIGRFLGCELVGTESAHDQSTSLAKPIPYNATPSAAEPGIFYHLRNGDRSLVL